MKPQQKKPLPPPPQKKPLQPPPPQKKPVRATKKCALIVGSNYPNTPYKLNGCLNDVDFMQTYLQKTCNFNSVTTLTDKSSLKPTKQNTLNAFKALLQNSQPGDKLVFCYSGHGSQVFDRNGEERDKNDEVLVCCDMQYVIDDELKAIVDQYMKPQTFLFCLFDSCHSGSAMDLQYQIFDSDSRNYTTTNRKNKQTKGQVVLISGCKDSQTSADAYINSTFRGAMLWSFLQVVEKTPTTTYRNLINGMRNALQTNGYTQIPQLSAGRQLNVDTNLIL